MYTDFRILNRIGTMWAWLVFGSELLHVYTFLGAAWAKTRIRILARVLAAVCMCGCCQTSIWIPACELCYDYRPDAGMSAHAFGCLRLCVCDGVYVSWWWCVCLCVCVCVCVCMCVLCWTINFDEYCYESTTLRDQPNMYTEKILVFVRKIRISDPLAKKHEDLACC